MEKNTSIEIIDRMLTRPLPEQSLAIKTKEGGLKFSALKGMDSWERISFRPLLK